MKYYIIAGEASGDLHGSNLMKSIYAEDPAAEICFWGGDLMQKAGGKLIKHYKELAFMGFIEVV
jgi:lipid-A-disaccharide synthase